MVRQGETPSNCHPTDRPTLAKSGDGKLFFQLLLWATETPSIDFCIETIVIASSPFLATAATTTSGTFPNNGNNCKKGKKDSPLFHSSRAAFLQALFPLAFCGFSFKGGVNARKDKNTKMPSYSIFLM